MKLIGNILWFIFGGLEIGLGYICGGIVFCLTIIGIPFGLQLFKLGLLAMFPFGSDVINVDNSDTGCLNTIANIIWIFIGGIWISIAHITLGLLFCITIIGIPFGKQHFKLAKLAFTPFGLDFS